MGNVFSSLGSGANALSGLAGPSQNNQSGNGGLLSLFSQMMAKKQLEKAPNTQIPMPGTDPFGSAHDPDNATASLPFMFNGMGNPPR